MSGADDSSSPAASSTSSGVGGGTGSGGGAGGDEAVTCARVAWVGEPVKVPISSTERVDQPRIVRTSAADFGVAYALTTSPQQPVTIGSFGVSAPLASWPPMVGAPNVNFPTPGPYALSAGEPGEIGFVAGDSGGQLVLGGFAPGENGSTFVELPLPSSPVHFVARTLLGAYLIGSGGPTLLRVDWVSAMGANPIVAELGIHGCGSPGVRAAATAFTNADEYWITGSADVPFDDCADPDIPVTPVYGQLLRAAAPGVTPHSQIEYADAPTDVGVAATDDSVYILHAVGTDAWLWYGGVDQILSAELSTAVPARYDIASIGEQLALVELIGSDVQPGGELHLRIFDADGEIASLSSVALPPFARSEPAVFATAEDGGKILVAYIDEDGVVVLARADCIPQ